MSELTRFFGRRKLAIKEDQEQERLEREMEAREKARRKEKKKGL